jgi:hypothetical protein
MNDKINQVIVELRNKAVLARFYENEDKALAFEAAAKLVEEQLATIKN